VTEWDSPRKTCPALDVDHSIEQLEPPAVSCIRTVRAPKDLRPDAGYRRGRPPCRTVRCPAYAVARGQDLAKAAAGDDG
ncbi:MAG: hypothetical protein ABR534_16985, partial [Desulfotignum sp.]